MYDFKSVPDLAVVKDIVSFDSRGRIYSNVDWLVSGSLEYNQFPASNLFLVRYVSLGPGGQISKATLGVVGYGDIGQACAQKAKALGMKIIAQRKRPELSRGDGVADEVLGVDQVEC